MKADKTAKYSPQRGYKNPQDVFNKRSGPIKKNITSDIISRNSKNIKMQTTRLYLTSFVTI